ncbi:hypothetical protein V495_03740 [Pseudogymnoascus sp. VKM F-4514 (FW-929)]|nr:hypothetical protein V495_03740 [Pseudogymnoascus sp. VKM F-4514 (FW-929)]KFY61493.1 hypothetical protein V497_02937 [Pseudogymnoascus sp. VKM F-4516 (FW-969)]
MEYMPTRQPPRIAKLGQQVVLTNHTLLPHQPRIRRLHPRHQIRLTKLVAAVVQPQFDGNPIPILFCAQRAERTVEQLRVHGVEAVDLGPPVVPDEFVGRSVETLRSEVVEEEVVGVETEGEGVDSVFGLGCVVAVESPAPLQLIWGNCIVLGVGARDGWVVVEKDADGVVWVVAGLALHAGAVEV